jgi:hypothetical protein
MHELLRAQRVDRGRGEPRRAPRGRGKPSRRRVRRPVDQRPIFQAGGGLPTWLAAPQALVRLAAGLFRRNRYLFVTAGSLLFLAATALVFSVALQGSLDRSRPSSAPAPAAASAANEAGRDDSTRVLDASARALDAAYDELGAGASTVTRSLVRDRDVEYVLQEGDSLYSVGKLYVVGARELQDFNRIADPGRLPVGSTIVIPSKSNLDKFLKERARLLEAARFTRPVSAPAPASLLPPGLSISAASRDGALLSVSLKTDQPLPEDVFYQWDLGDGSISHAPAVTYQYATPGTYAVSLTVRDRLGYERKSNVVSVEVGAPETASLHRTLFLTVNAVGDTFTLPAKVTQVDDFLGRTDKPVQFVEERDGSCFYRALAPGNYSLIARGGETVYKIYLFVSPFPSVQNDRFDVDWYRTQYDTGTSSNCGPASVSMAVGWAKGDYVSVAAIRNYIGFQGDGGTSFPQLERALAWRGVQAREVDLVSLDDVFAVIDRGEIAVILFHTARIARVRGRPDTDYVGRYYTDAVGHYVVIKGYTTDRKYFVVYDPLPSDWSSNGTRYGDGYSMIGRNRFYSVAEMARALSLPRMLVVSR